MKVISNRYKKIPHQNAGSPSLQNQLEVWTNPMVFRAPMNLKHCILVNWIRQYLNKVLNFNKSLMLKFIPCLSYPFFFRQSRSLFILLLKTPLGTESLGTLKRRAMYCIFSKPISTLVLNRKG